MRAPLLLLHAKKGYGLVPLSEVPIWHPDEKPTKIQTKDGCWELGSIGTSKFVDETRAFRDLILPSKVLPQLRTTSCEALCGHAIS